MSSEQTFHSVSTPTAIKLVAGREIGSRITSKSFIFSSLFLMVAVLGLIIVTNIIGSNQSASSVAVVGDDAGISSIEGIDAVPADSREAAEELVTSGDVDAAIVPDPSAAPLGFVLLADDEPPTDVLALLSVSPQVELLNTAEDGNPLAFIATIVIGTLFMTTAITFGATIAQSVVEEKATRVVEILISAIPVRALLTGKILGNTVLALVQVLVVIVTALIGLLATGQGEILEMVSTPMLWFLPFFIIGFVLIAAMFAAGASMVSRQEDIGSTMTPMMFLVFVPFYLVIFFYQNDLVMTILSYVPFSSPMAMPGRLVAGTAEWWEPLLAIVVLLITTLVAIVVGSTIYRNSLLRTGSRVPLREALRG